MDLLEPSLQPVQLGRVDASVRAARVANRVQRDEANDAFVMRVVRSALARVAVREAMGAAPHMSVDKLGARDRSPLWIGLHVDGGPVRESLRMVDEGLDRPVRIQARRRLDRLA